MTGNGRNIKFLIWWPTAVLLTLAFLFVSSPSSAKQPPQVSSSKKAAPQKQSSGEVRRERDNTERDIASSRVKLSTHSQRISDQMDRLNDIESQIIRQEGTIDEINLSIEEMTERSAILEDSIRILQREDSLLCIQIAKGLRERHVQARRLPALAFISSSKDLRQAQARLNYLDVQQRAKNARVRQLREKRQELKEAKTELDRLKNDRASAVKQLATAKDILKTRKNEVRDLVDDLRSQESELEKFISEKKKLLDLLNIDLNRIIFEEQKQAQKKKANANNTATSASAIIPNLTGTFQSNKGKLLFPVPGRYSIVGTFGRSRHKELSHVQLDNSGIDISVSPGTQARAVFDGEITSVVFMENYENVIIIRHGKYLTVYAGLESIKVKKGDKVRTGQDLGKIASVGGRTVLHFEVRNERDKLNPLLWVR